MPALLQILKNSNSDRSCQDDPRQREAPLRLVRGCLFGCRHSLVTENAMRIERPDARPPEAGSDVPEGERLLQRVMNIEDRLEVVLEARAGLAEVLLEGREHGQVEGLGYAGGVGGQHCHVDRGLLEEQSGGIAHSGGMPVEDEKSTLVRGSAATLDERNENRRRPFAKHCLGHPS